MPTSAFYEMIGNEISEPSNTKQNGKREEKVRESSYCKIKK